jgi:hypothetical protein
MTEHKRGFFTEFGEGRPALKMSSVDAYLLQNFDWNASPKRKQLLQKLHWNTYLKRLACSLLSVSASEQSYQRSRRQAI